MSVYIENETPEKLPDNYEYIVKDVIAAAIDFLKCPYECELNVIFTDNEGIKEMNAEYRDIASPTDVLSFPLIEYEIPGNLEHVEDDSIEYFNQDTGELMLGDIVLNVDRIASQAVEYGHTRRRELAFLTAHSMLHLFGYDHIDEDERAIMEDLQEQILKTKGYTRENEEE
jgi:probable rRNA maturation factor